MTRSQLYLVFAIALCLCTWRASPVAAHPHVWTSLETEILFDGQGEITGLKHSWTFDEYYSADAILGLDKNGDGILSEDELKPLADTNVDALQEFGYFTYAKIGDQKIALKKPTEYHLDYKDKLLTLVFVLPFEKPVPQGELNKFKFSVYDPSYYVAMTFKELSPIKIKAPSHLVCTSQMDHPLPPKQTTLSQMGENIDPASQFGAQYAQTVKLSCKAKR